MDDLTILQKYEDLCNIVQASLFKLYTSNLITYEAIDNIQSAVVVSIVEKYKYNADTLQIHKSIIDNVLTRAHRRIPLCANAQMILAEDIIYSTALLIALGYTDDDIVSILDQPTDEISYATCIIYDNKIIDKGDED